MGWGKGKGRVVGWGGVERGKINGRVGYSKGKVG